MKCSRRHLFQISPMVLTKSEAQSLAKPLRKARHCVVVRSILLKSGRKYGVFAGPARKR